MNHLNSRLILMVTVLLAVALFAPGSGTFSDMNDCPFMAEMTVCPMTIAGHVVEWRSLYAPVVELLLALVALLVITFIARPSLMTQGRVKMKRRHRYRPWICYLEDLFSDGILHPKKFAA